MWKLNACDAGERERERESERVRVMEVIHGRDSVTVSTIRSERLPVLPRLAHAKKQRD